MAEPFKVYAAEISDGLEERLRAPEARAATALARITTSIDPSVFQIVQKASAGDIAMAEEALGLSRDNFDLYPLHTILASTGWNKNDDVFDNTETWQARRSPEDKPFNLGHDPNKIIGHITGSVGVDANYKVMDETADLPETFHILTRSVIYKHVSSRDPGLTQEVAELIEGIDNGEWFVSMEVLFGGFDYGIIDPNGHQQVIARQENTAFLTKHLRAYGGTGKYDDNRVGRVLRHMTFSGKALVRNPANPESIIFNDTEIFKGVLASSQETEELTTGVFNMSDQIVTDLKDKNADLERKLSEASHKLEEMGEAAVKAKLDAKDSTIAELETKVSVHAKTIEELIASVKETETSRDMAVAAKIETEEKLTKAEEQMTASKAEAQKASRISVLVDKGVDKAAAEELVASFDILDDDKFNKLVEIQAELVAAKCSGDKEKDDKKKKGDDKKSDKSDAEDSDKQDDDDDTSDDDDKADAEDVLDDAEEDKDSAMGSADDDDSADDDSKELQSSIASYLGGYLGDRKQDGGKN